MIYDCFRFFNEFDLLEVRFETLWDFVDKFVLVEADRTDSNNPKPLHYEENKERFAKYHEKIIHVVVRDYDGTTTPSGMDIYQRNCIMRGLVEANDDDIILISDVDEIPDPSCFTAFSQLTRGWYSVCLVPMLYYYRFNMQMYMKPESWIDLLDFGTRAILYRELKLTTPSRVRLCTDGFVVKNAGWHFSYIGNADAIIKKIEAFCHQDLNKEKFKDKEHIAEIIRSGKDLFGRAYGFTPVQLDNTFPAFLVKNQERFKEFIA